MKERSDVTESTSNGSADRTTAVGKATHNHVTLVDHLGVGTSGLHAGANSLNDTSSVTVEDQTAAVGEVGADAISIVLTGHSSSVDLLTSSRAITLQERNVVGLVDLDTGDLIETFTGLQRTTVVAQIAVEDVGVNLADQSIICLLYTSDAADE